MALFRQFQYEILCPLRAQGGMFYQGRAKAFVKVLSHYGLIDINAVGGKFTWATRV